MKNRSKSIFMRKHIFIFIAIFASFAIGDWKKGVTVERVTSYDDGAIYIKISPEITTTCTPSSVSTYGNFRLARDANGIYKDKLSILLTAQTTGSLVDIFYIEGSSTSQYCVPTVIMIKK